MFVLKVMNTFPESFQIVKPVSVKGNNGESRSAAADYLSPAAIAHVARTADHDPALFLLTEARAQFI